MPTPIKNGPTSPGGRELRKIEALIFARKNASPYNVKNLRKKQTGYHSSCPNYGILFFLALLLLSAFGMLRVLQDGGSRQKLEIHVLLFNRIESARKIFGNLAESRYRGSVDLHIHVDYNHKNSSKTDMLHHVAQSFQWQYGEKKIIRHVLNEGLRRSWLEISPDCTRISAIAVLEDDLLTSPDWHEWYTKVWSWIEWHESINESSILGVSLTPLMKNELVFPFQKWTPNTSLSLFLHQVPSSWGPIFPCRAWQSFLKYAKIRQEDVFEYERTQGVSMLGVRPGDPNFNIPGLHSNWWAGSWKKYMIEYALAKEKYFIYPNVEFGKAGFAMLATDDSGEHTTSSTEFQSGLHVGKFRLPRLPSDLRSYDLWFDNAEKNKVENVAKLFVDRLREKGGPYGQIATVLLPSFRPGQTSRRGRYLMYLPEFGVNNQIISLAIAIKMAMALERVLLVPHLFHPRLSLYTSCIGDDACLEFSDFFRLEDLHQALPDLRFVILTSGNLPYYQPKRIVELEKPSLFDKRETIYFQKLTRTSVSEDAFMDYVKKAHDSILLLDNIYFANVFFSQKELGDLRKMIMAPNTRLRRLTQQVKQNLKLYPKTCIHLRYTDFNEVCGRFRQGENAFYKRMRDQGYVCMPSDEEVRQIVAVALHSGQVLLVTDDSRRVEELATNNKHVLTSKQIANEVRRILPLGNRHFCDAAQAIIEQQICSQATTAILNRLSTYSLSIDLLRDHEEVKWFSQEFLSEIHAQQR